MSIGEKVFMTGVILALFSLFFGLAIAGQNPHPALKAVGLLSLAAAAMAIFGGLLLGIWA